MTPAGKEAYRYDLVAHVDLHVGEDGLQLLVLLVVLQQLLLLLQQALLQGPGGGQAVGVYWHVEEPVDGGECRVEARQELCQCLCMGWTEPRGVGGA